MPRRAVGVVVGVVDADLQRERDHQREQRRARGGSRRARRRRRCRPAPAPAAAGRVRGRAPATHWAGVAIRPPGSGAATARRSGLPVCRSGTSASSCSWRGAAGAPSRSATQARQLGELRAPCPGPGRRRPRPAAPTRRRAGRRRPRRRPPGASRSAASTAAGATLTPPVMTTSSSRPVTVSRPSVAGRRRRGCGTSRRRTPRRSPTGSQPVAERQHRAGQLDAAVGDPHADAVQRLAVVDAAAGGLGHAVGGHDRDARRRGRGRAAPGRWPRRRPGPRRRRAGRRARRRGTGAAGSAPARCSGGRPACGRRRRRAARPRASTVTGSPASTLRQSTCRPAIAETGRASSQAPGPPSRSWVAVAEASSAVGRQQHGRGRRRWSRRSRRRGRRRARAARPGRARPGRRRRRPAARPGGRRAARVPSRAARTWSGGQVGAGTRVRCLATTGKPTAAPN